MDSPRHRDRWAYVESQYWRLKDEDEELLETSGCLVQMRVLLTSFDGFLLAVVFKVYKSTYEYFIGRNVDPRIFSCRPIKSPAFDKG